MFCGSRVELFYANFFFRLLTLLSAFITRVSLNFYYPLVLFCGSRTEVVLRPIFVTRLSRACIETRGLITLNFSRPGLVYHAFCCSRAEVVLRPIFCYLTLSSVCWNQGLNCAEFFTALVLFTMCFVAPEQTQVDLRPIFVT